MALQATLYIYDHNPEQRLHINNNIQFYLIIVLLSLFFCTFLIAVSRTLSEILKVKRYFKGATRVANSVSEAENKKKKLNCSNFSKLRMSKGTKNK